MPVSVASCTAFIRSSYLGLKVNVKAQSIMWPKKKEKKGLHKYSMLSSYLFWGVKKEKKKKKKARLKQTLD